MTRGLRRKHGPAFKAKVAVAAIVGERTPIDPAQDLDVRPNWIEPWRDQSLEGATGVFGDGPKAERAPVIYVKTLHVEIGELALENDVPQRLRGPNRGHGPGYDVRRALHCAVNAIGSRGPANGYCIASQTPLGWHPVTSSPPTCPGNCP